MTARSFDPVHPDALAVYCSDGRFTRSVEDHMRSLGHERFDTLTVPGGPALLHLGGTSSLMHVDHVRSSASFLARGHGTRHVALFAHAGCGWYLSHWGLSLPDPNDVLRQQLDDLACAGRWARAAFDIVDVRCFLVHPREHGGVVFEEAPLP